MTPEQQAIENLVQMAHGFVEAQAAILRNAAQCVQNDAGDAQTQEQVQVEGTSNFA